VRSYRRGINGGCWTNNGRILCGGAIFQVHFRHRNADSEIVSLPDVNVCLCGHLGSCGRGGFWCQSVRESKKPDSGRAVQSTDPAAIAHAVALTFMGERTDNWSEEKLAGMSVFFSQISYKPTREWKEEIVGRDLSRAPGNEEKTAIFPDGTSVRLSPDKGPRAVFADWSRNHQ